MLMPVEIDLLTKKKDGKLDTILSNGTSGIEIMLILLAKIVVFYI